MLWKIWCGDFGERPRLVEADSMDEAMEAARREFPGACAAQPCDGRYDGPEDRFLRAAGKEAR